ncbi:MAG: hypothetical protein NC117_02715 [Pseudoflavonifractor sp.]|nr:hypothetical protein [Pseudoflavonifractor sp.]
MSLDEFCRCDYDEFEAICRAWREMTEARRHDEWERTRLLATICIQPHVRKRVTPRQLMPLPWDGETKRRPVEAPELTPAERLARFERLSKTT